MRGIRDGKTEMSVQSKVRRSDGRRRLTEVSVLPIILSLQICDGAGDSLKALATSF